MKKNQIRYWENELNHKFVPNKRKTTMLQEILDSYPEESFLKADGFDNCVIGVCFECDKPRLIYSVRRIISQLTGEGMNFEDAIEHYGYNIAGSYVGEQTPIWCYDLFE